MGNKSKKIFRPKARLPKGMRDVQSAEISAMASMLDMIRQSYHLYGFEALETPAFEYSDALGKSLPDQDRPNAGVFSFEDEDGQWLSLRYDLTAPLARYVAEHYDSLPKPFRRYQTGYVWRNEKARPGRFRQFRQFDADSVGVPGVAADAELCMLASQTIEKLGIARGQYVMRVNNRKILDGVLEMIGVDPHNAESLEMRMTILRSIDKLDRLGIEGVEALLGEGRKDESGAYTKGAGLEAAKIEKIIAFVNAGNAARQSVLDNFKALVGNSETGMEGVSELSEMDALFNAAGFDSDRIIFDPSIVRGLDYYTGPVFEAELTFDATDEDGNRINFGSVGGGGRYDGLIAKFKGVEVPATGFSLGVSRLYAALEVLGKFDQSHGYGPVIVMVMDKDRLGDYQKMVGLLRAAGIRSEMYLGGSGMRAQMKYADKRNVICTVIQGSDELARGEVMLKDLVEGMQKSREIDDNKSWREGRPAQFAVKEDELVEAVRSVLARYEEA